MKIRKMLFVTHFDELRFDSLRSLLTLKKADLNHVVLLNVIERKRVSMRRGTGYLKKAEIKLREKANIRFIDWAETLFELGMEVGVHIVVGDFASQVIKTAKTENVDLIVIGPDKKKGIQELSFGSNLTEIVGESGKPVLVYKDSSNVIHHFENIFERPMLTTNWILKNDEVLVAIVKGLKNIVNLVDIIHVAKDKDFESSSAMAVQKTRKITRQKLELLCEKIEKEGIVAKSHVYVGDVAFEIDKAAKECESTMIIIGFSKKGRWGERWKRSLGRKIARNSIFPTLLIPPYDD